MRVWRVVGELWDRALDGDAAGAAALSDSLRELVHEPADRAVLLAFRAFCELMLCDYEAGAETAALALDERPPAGVALFYVQAMQLLAAAMGVPDPAASVPVFEELHTQVGGVAREAGGEALLVLHPLIEAGMATGRFVTVAQLVDGYAASPDAMSPDARSSSVASTQVGSWVRLQYVRACLFGGRLDAVDEECTALVESGATTRHPRVGMLVDAVLCYTAAQRADRAEVDARSAPVLAAAAKVVDYVQVGSCLLVAWSFSTIGQVQRAAALLLAAAGGPELSRVKTWDRAFGYELLVGAALQRNDIAAARGWADRATPLGGFEVAAAAVQRALSRVAVATGEPGRALDHATASVATDVSRGASIDELHSRMLVAMALVASGNPAEAIENLSSTARAAELLGAAAVRLRASRELRRLTDRRGGWESLTDRERQVAGLVAEGHTNRAIASTLFLSDRTVQSHVSSTLRALGAVSRAGIPALVGTAFSGEPPRLTERQQEVAFLVAHGRSNAAIAGELGISAKTVEKHLASIFERWNVSSRTSVATIQLGRR